MLANKRVNKQMNEAQQNIKSAKRRFFETGYLKDNPVELQRLSVAIYRLLLGGAPITLSRIAAATGIGEARVDALFALIPDSAFDHSDDGEISAFIGLSTRPANHEFITGGRTLYTWCVFDGLFLAEATGKEATIATRCPATGAEIRVDLSPTGIIGATPEEPVMSLINPDIDACCNDLRGAFCNHVNFFASEAAFGDWAEDKPEYAPVTLQAAHAMAQKRNRQRYPDIDLASVDIQRG